MILEKMPWAGIRVSTEETAILIDPISSMPDVFGAPHEPFYPLTDFGPAQAILLTHSHRDHFDAEAILKAFGKDIKIFVPAGSIEDVKKYEFNNVFGVHVGDTHEIGSMRVIAADAVDGFGSPQISWVVEGNGRKMIHSGDTLWHGFWWKIARLYGPFDVTCFPINAAMITPPGVQPSGEQAVMSPEQAVAATKLLGASKLVPIHYKTFHSPPVYIEAANVVERAVQSGSERGVKVQILHSMEQLNLLETKGGN